MAAFWAVANNVVEIRGDAFKLCRVCQRTMPRRVKDIGAWQVINASESGFLGFTANPHRKPFNRAFTLFFQRAFEAVGAMSIMTNCGLMCISPQLRNLAPEMGNVEWVLLFVFVEHVLLAIRYVLNETIPEKPDWVRIALAKINYQSKQALKKEREAKNKHISEKWKPGFKIS